MTDSAPRFRVVDDFLDEEAWTAVWTHLQFEELNPVTRTSGAWKLDDGTPFGGREVVAPHRSAASSEDPGPEPEGEALSRVLATLIDAPDLWGDLVGDGWTRVTARTYVYPRGTALSWHSDDTELFTGAYVYYAHPRWNAHWGGELLLADGDPEEMMGYRFETEGYSEQLLERGTGRFVSPKPNRLVVLGAVPHAVAPVRDAAGDAVRASVSGFFLR